MIETLLLMLLLIGWIVYHFREKKAWQNYAESLDQVILKYHFQDMTAEEELKILFDELEDEEE